MLNLSQHHKRVLENGIQDVLVFIKLYFLEEKRIDFVTCEVSKGKESFYCDLEMDINVLGYY